MSKLKNNQLIAGYGEVGKGLHRVIKRADILDFEHSTAENRTYDVLHVCFPFTPSFASTLRTYRKKYRPKLVIIHSTVPIGTSRSLSAVHSPIRGVHPNIDVGIKTFVKYFGGKGASDAAHLFKKLGVRTRVFAKAETTEAIKLWDTTQYGWQIILAKEVHEWCARNGLNFEEVYREANRDYNEGYVKLGRNEVVRPYLYFYPGPIGGHCVVPNARLLKSEIAEYLLKFDRKLRKHTKKNKRT